MATKTIACGNRAVHGRAPAHHETVAQVRLCFAREGGLLSLEETERYAAMFPKEAPLAPHTGDPEPVETEWDRRLKTAPLGHNAFLRHMHRAHND